MLGSNNLTQGRIGRLHGNLGGTYFDCLGDRGGRERKIQLAMFIHLQPHVLLLDRPEALGVHVNRVIPDGQQRHEVMAAIVGFRLARNTCALRGGLYSRARNYRPCFVGDRAGKAPSRLAIQKWATGKYERTEQDEQRLSGSHQSPPRRSASNGDATRRFPTKVRKILHLHATMHPDLKSFQDSLRPSLLTFSN